MKVVTLSAWFCFFVGSTLALWGQCTATQRATQQRLCERGCWLQFPRNELKYELCVNDCVSSRCGPPNNPYHLPYDLVSPNEDLNGLPLNPHWGQQEGALGDANALPDQGSCSTPWEWPCTSNNTTIVPIAGSTAEFGEAVAVAGALLGGAGLVLTGLGAVIPGVIHESCQFSGPGGIAPASDPFNPATGHHVNWQTITYTGTACWDTLADNDHDVNIAILRDDQALYTKQNSTDMLTEFSADETIEMFTKGWWKNFHDAAHDGKADRLCVGTKPAQRMIDNLKVIEIGVLGLDCAHSCGSEIHPVYAMALHVKPDPTDDTWAIFARNWGDEGFCGQVNLPETLLNRIFLKLDWIGTSRLAPPTVNMATSQWQTPDGSGVQVKTFPYEDVRQPGFVVEIDLGDPSNLPFVAGELHLQWPGANVLSPPPPARPRAVPVLTATSIESGERFEKFVAGLPPDIHRQVLDAMAKKPAPPRMVTFRSITLAEPPSDFKAASLARLRPGGPRPSTQAARYYKGDSYQKVDKILRDNNIKLPSR